LTRANTAAKKRVSFPLRASVLRIRSPLINPAGSSEFFPFAPDSCFHALPICSLHSLHPFFPFGPSAARRVPPLSDPRFLRIPYYPTPLLPLPFQVRAHVHDGKGSICRPSSLLNASEFQALLLHFLPRSTRILTPRMYISHLLSLLSQFPGSRRISLFSVKATHCFFPEAQLADSPPLPCPICVRPRSYSKSSFFEAKGYSLSLPLFEKTF